MKSLGAVMDSYDADEDMESDEDMEMDDDGMEERKMAAKDVMSAVKSGDVDELEASLHSYIMACGYKK